MKRKHMVCAAAAVLACAALTGAALALSTGDSLISLSYLNDTYIPTVVAQGTKAADEKLIQAYQAASQKLDEVNQGYGVQQGSGGSYSADLRSRDMVRGDQLKLPTGSVVQLAAGAGTVVHTGAVIDVTAGQTVASGAALVSGHRYLVGEDTSAVFTVDSGLAKVGVQGSFEKTESGEKAAPFTDVSRSDWYSSAVDYVYFEQLFSGTGDGLFSPMASMDRAMIVTVFYNMAGAPQGEMDASTAVFSDVPAGQWYAPYVSWAADQGVTAGTGEDTFSPEQAVTRREAVALLYSFGTNYLGLELTERADLTPYEDAAAVASWGGEAVAWAVGAGLLSSSDADLMLLSPDESATRAQVAVILTRFCETVMPDGPVSHQEMVRNLQNSSLRKKDTLAAMAQVLLDDGFAPAFVAGLLGNIIEEGDCGRFESSAYLSNPDAEPDYLVYMDENYDYRDKYSYRLIYEGISLQEVYAMVLELGPEGANGRGSCFGLGCMQWTSYNRIKRLLENYLEAADGADTITLAQVQEAEGITISYELRNTHKKVYTDWQTANPEQDTEEAAYDAGVKVCTSYGIPVGYNTPEVQEKRGGNAAQVYAVMLGES